MNPIGILYTAALVASIAYTVRIAYFVHYPARRKILFAKYKKEKSPLAYAIYRKNYSQQSMIAWILISTGWILFFISSLASTTQLPVLGLIVGAFALTSSLIGFTKLSSITKEERRQLFKDRFDKN